MSDEAQAAAHAHCWHSTSISRTTLALGNNNGVDSVRCCRCGMMGERYWTEQARRIPGHGPYATRSVRVPGEVHVFGAAECPVPVDRISGVNSMPRFVDADGIIRTADEV